MILLLLAGAPAPVDAAGTICEQAKTWATRIRRHVGLQDYLDRWRCDVVEDLGDGTWRVAGLYGQQGRATQEPYVMRLYGPIIGVWGYCELALGRRRMPIRGPADECERPAAEPEEGAPPV